MSEKLTYEELEQRVRELELAESKRKIIDETNKNTSELLSFFIKHSPIYTFLKKVSHKNSQVLYASDNYIDMTSIPASQMVGKTMHELFPKEFAEKITVDDIAVINKGNNLILDEELNGRNYVTYKFPLMQGENKYLAGYTVDITERKQTEEALRESERYLKTVLGVSPVGIGLVVNRKLNWANKTMYSMVGYEQDTLLDQSACVLYPDEKEFERVGKLLYVGIAESGIGQAETRWVRKDGTVFDCIIRLTSLDPSDSAKGQIVSVTDISKFKKAEEEKRKAQKIAGGQKQLALVGQVAGKMAHDFNNILGIIMGNAQLLISRNLDDKIKQKLDLIINQTLRGRNLTKNLVAFAKDQEPKQEFFKITEKIDLVVALMKKDLENISLNRSDAFDVPDLLADPGMIEHAIVNLLQNSIHSLSLAPLPEITIKTFCRDGHIFLQIQDNGCGIPEIHLKSIYAPSFSLKGSRDTTGSYSSLINGTGYGMANVKKYIEQHRGSISVESEPGVGTQFTIKLPVINKELTVEEKKTIEERQIYPGQRILLVEDEVDISDVQYTILSDNPLNHKVDIAHNGHMALDLFGRNSYDLVSLDYILPGDINGMDIYHHIRRKKSGIPILFTSGNLEFLQSIKELKAKDKMIDHISKPCQNKEYIDQINKLLDRRNN